MEFGFILLVVRLMIAVVFAMKFTVELASTNLFNFNQRFEVQSEQITSFVDKSKSLFDID